MSCIYLQKLTEYGKRPGIIAGDSVEVEFQKEQIFFEVQGDQKEWKIIPLEDLRVSALEGMIKLCAN